MAFLKAIRDALRPDDHAAREQLDLLKKAATSELKTYRDELRDKIRNPDAFKEEIVPKRMFASMEQYRVDVDEGASDEMGRIIDTFFEGEDHIKDGFKSLIKFGFKAILGSEEIGESKTSNWYVTMERGALIRVDVMCWRWNFTAQGIIASCKSAFCFTCTKSFVDTRDLTTQELTYFIAKSLGLESIDQILHDPNIRDYIHYLQTGLSNRSLEDTMRDYISGSRGVLNELA